MTCFMSKSFKFLLIIFLLVILPINFSTILAEDVNSNNYQIKDLSFGSVGSEETSSNFSLLLSNNDNLSDEKLNSTNYKIGVGINNTWKANVPIVQCFETTTNGTTNCEDPDISNGMTALCGDGGCYNRARFEIDTQLNPSDTLYSVQITTDPTWSTWDYVDGNTFQIEQLSTHTIDDYLTESSWENNASNFNIIGLAPNTGYFIRITTLHGDFTESEPGPSAGATTSVPQITFDIDIADEPFNNIESSSPYEVNFENLVLGTVSNTTQNIWLDFGTNINNGASVNVRNLYNGLFSASQTYTLPSITTDLAINPGYGMRGDQITQQNLGPVQFSPNFNLTNDNVEALNNNQIGKQLIFTNGPLNGGRASVILKARPAEDSPSGLDYTDTVIFTVLSN